MFLSETSIKRPVLTTVVTLGLVMMGLLAYFGLPLNTMPEVTIPVITVQVVYPGAGPEEIETNITKKIEDEVSTVSGLDFIESMVMSNVNMTIIRFDMDKDIDVANQEVKDKIDAIISEFPDDAEAPVVMKFDINAEPILFLSFISTMSPKDGFDYVDKNLKDRFARVPGVSQVQITGGQKREIQVKLSRSVLDKYNISPLQISQAIAVNNLDMPAGSIQKNGAEYSVKVEGQFDDIETLRNLRIQTPQGERKLFELASIIDGEEELEKVGRFYNFEKNGNKINDDVNVINLSIKKQSDANTVQVAEKVIEEIAKINAQLPDGSSIEIGKDNSVFVKDSVNDTLSSIFLGIVFTAIILYIFLHSMKSTLIVGISMPLVLISTFLLAQSSDFSLNIMSLMALSVSVGTLVTNSVVILENIDRYINMGFSSSEAADKGTGEIAVAVIASTLTNVAVFVPIASMESIVGQFFVEFGLMVTYAMLFSIMISFTVTPMLASKLLKGKKKDGEEKPTKKGLMHWISYPSVLFAKAFDGFFDTFNKYYKKVLRWILTSLWRRIAIVLLSIGMLYMSIVVVIPNMGNEFMPFVDDGDIEISVEMPTYYTIEKTSDVFTIIEKTLSKYDEVARVITNIGELNNSEAPNKGKITVKLVAKDKRNVTTNEFVGILSEELYDIPDANLKISPVSSFGEGDGSKPISIEVYGLEINKLEEITKQVYQIAKETKGTLNIDTDIREGKPELKLYPDRQKLADFGISVQQLAATLRAQIEGVVAASYKEGGEEYDIRVQLADNDVNDLEKVQSLYILTPKGNKKISELADIEYSKAPAMITRKNKNKKYKIDGNNIGRTAGEIIAEIMARVEKEVDIPEGYKVLPAGNQEMMQDAMADFLKAFFIAVALTFMLIAGILESYKQSILIMSTLPLALIGVLWSLFLTGESMNIMSMMAGVMLIGIVVNNAILILDYANQLRRHGQSTLEAIVDACPTKLKAVVMATLASIFGMLPLALGLGSGAEMRQGMGIVSIGGLLVSSLLTLLVIPALYMTFVYDHKKEK